MADHTGVPRWSQDPDGRHPSCQVRCHSLADVFLPATLAVVFGTHSGTGVEPLGPVQVDGQPSEIAAIPKLPRHRR